MSSEEDQGNTAPDSTKPAGLEEQDKKFSYKSPESLYKKHEPGMIGQGKAATGVSPMDFYLRQNAAKKAEKAKEAETKRGVYKSNFAQAFF